MPDLKPARPLRLARVRAGWRIGALAQAIDVAETTLWRLETGLTKEPSQKTRTALGTVLGVAPSKLFGKTGR